MEIALAEPVHGQTIDSGRLGDNTAAFGHCPRSRANGARHRWCQADLHETHGVTKLTIKLAFNDQAGSDHMIEEVRSLEGVPGEILVVGRQDRPLLEVLVGLSKRGDVPYDETTHGPIMIEITEGRLSVGRRRHTEWGPGR